MTRVALMVGRRRRRAASLKPPLGQCLVFAGITDPLHPLNPCDASKHDFEIFEELFNFLH